MFTAILNTETLRLKQASEFVAYSRSSRPKLVKFRVSSRGSEVSLFASLQRHVRRNTTRQGAGILSSAVPFEVLVKFARFAWRRFWLLLMEELAPSKGRSGSYDRPPPAYVSDNYRQGIKQSEIAQSEFALFYGLECPWCHRCLLAMNFYGLNDETSGAPIINSVRVYPSLDGKWVLAQADRKEKPGTTARNCLENLLSMRDLKEIYRKIEPSFAGRATAPLLIDLRAARIVSNESSDIVRFLREIARVRTEGLVNDLYPHNYQKQIEQDRSLIHEKLNNGVYKVGFAKNQTAYNEAESDVFETLKYLDEKLTRQRYVSGTPFPSESDVFLFPTLIRFDSVYHTLFRCSRRKLTEFHTLHAWLRDMVQSHRIQVSGTFDIEETTTSYFRSLFPLNPSGIVPSYDVGCLEDPHGREALK